VVEATILLPFRHISKNLKPRAKGKLSNMTNRHPSVSFIFNCTHDFSLLGQTGNHLLRLQNRLIPTRLSPLHHMFPKPSCRSCNGGGEEGYYPINHTAEYLKNDCKLLGFIKESDRRLLPTVASAAWLTVHPSIPDSWYALVDIDSVVPTPVVARRQWDAVGREPQHPPTI
jgi:hypothetical protein